LAFPNSLSFQIHEHDIRSFDFQSSFVFSLLPHEEFWHRIPISEAIDYNQSCSYDRMCVGIGSTGTAIALHHGENTPTILRALPHAPAGLDQGVSEPTDIFSNPSLHNDSDNGERRLHTNCLRCLHAIARDTIQQSNFLRAYTSRAGEFEVLAVELYMLKPTWD
jgi:hypothetical protein